MKPSYYDEAVEAAADAIASLDGEGANVTGRAAIDAALPIIEAGVRADERRRIVAALDEKDILWRARAADFIENMDNKEKP